MRPLKNQYQVIIVGGGLVGATLAIALKDIGVDLLVVEAFEQSKSEQPSFDDRSVALSYSSLKFLKQLNVSKDIEYYGEAIKNIHVSDQGNYGFSRIESDKLKIDLLGKVVENRALGKILLDKIKAEKIEYLCPAKVTSVISAKKSKHVDIDLNGEKVSVACELLILAEGARSPLKKLLGFETEITDFRTEAVVCNIQTQIPHDGWAFERFTKNGPLALLPLSKNRMSIVWSNNQETAKELLEISEPEFAMRLEKIFGSRLGRIEKIGKRSIFPMIQSVSKSTVKDHCMLIGNSAQSLHPIAGQGLNLALRDIAELKKLFGHRKEKDLLGKLKCLSEYENLRLSDRRQTIQATETLARLFSNDFQPLSFSRNLILKLLDITPVAKESFVTKAMGFR